MAEASHPTTAVEICNLSLARLGQTVEITSILSPVGKPAILCAQHYPVIRRKLLRGPRVFNFAKEYVQITVDAIVTPAFGFSSAFRLPNDFLRFLTLGDIDDKDPQLTSLYKIRGLHIFTDETDEDDTLNLSYIRDVTLVGLWDALFVDLMRLELAKALAGPLTLKASLVKDLDAELRDVRLEAGAVSAQENPPIRISRSSWIQDRRLGGLNRDITRHPI